MVLYFLLSDFISISLNKAELLQVFYLQHCQFSALILQQSL